MPTEEHPYELVDARHGRFLVNRNDTYVGRSLREYGEWSEAELGLFGQLLRKGDVVVEAGANIGSHTVRLSRIVGENGHVVAFEPQRLTHQLLCANLALNECFNVDARRMAVGDSAGSIQVPDILPLHSINYGAVSLLQPLAGADHTPVPLCKLDDLNLDRLDFIKADIEGFEPALLRGAHGAIGKHRPAVYLELAMSPLPRGNRDELVTAMQAHGYRCFYYLTPIFNPHNHRGNRADVFINQSSMDLLCVPPEKWSVSGLTEAQPLDNAIEIVDEGRGCKYALMPWDGVVVERMQRHE